MNGYPTYLVRNHFFNRSLFLKKVMSALSGMALFTGVKEPFVSSQKHNLWL